MSLSGVKDIDAKIINQLNDYELGKVCQTNKYINKICKDETFWMNRTVQKFGKYLGNVLEIKQKYNVTNWQSYYKNLIKKLNNSFKNGRRNLDKDVEILYDIAFDNTLDLLDKIYNISLKDFDEYINNHLIDYIMLSFNLHRRPDLLKYIIVRSKNDPTFFGIWDNGGKDIIFEYSAEEIDLLKPILNDPRSDPNEAIKSVVFRNDNYIEDLLKDPRITLEGIRDAMFLISEDYSINDLYPSFKILIPIYKQKGGDERIYKHLIRKIIENPQTNDDLFYNFLIKK